LPNSAEFPLIELLLIIRLAPTPEETLRIPPPRKAELELIVLLSTVTVTGAMTAIA